MKSLNRNTMIAAITGSVVVALLLIIGTFWTGRSASQDTEKAVSNVSLLYLEELAGRREQVLASTLNDRCGNRSLNQRGFEFEGKSSSVSTTNETALRIGKICLCE